MYITPQAISRGLDRVLLSVQKPARYTGGEFNSVVKDWEATPHRLALVFPDVYDLGMSNLGLAILYDIVNRQPDMLAERAYPPGWTCSRRCAARASPFIRWRPATPWLILMCLVFPCPMSSSIRMC